MVSVQYIVTSHSTHTPRISGFSMTSASLDLDSWNSSWSIACLKEYLRRKWGHRRLAFKNADLPERQASQSLPGIHHVDTACAPPVLFPSATWKKKPPGTNFACVATSSPCFLPASKIEWRHHLAQTPEDDGGGKHHAFSQCVYVLRTLTWETCGRKKNTDGSAPAFGKCLAFLGFKELADGRVYRLLGTSMKANIFLREYVLPTHTTVLLGTRKFYQSAWRMASKKALPELTWPLKTMR